MDLTQLANLGEFIGGVAVLVTLVYLALQMRQGNKAERADANRSWTREWNRAFLSPLQEPEFANMVRRASEDFASVSGDEQLAVSAFWASTINLGREMHFGSKDGSIDPEIAKEIDFLIVSLLQIPGVAVWWSVIKPSYSARYTRHLGELLDDPDRPPPWQETVPWMVANQAWDPRS